MKKRILALSLAAVSVLSAGFAGCKDGGAAGKLVTLYENGMAYTETVKGEAGKVDALYYDIMGGDEVMPIGGFYVPYASGGSLDGNDMPNFLTDYYFEVLAEAGINMFMYSLDRHSYGSSNPNITAALSLCEKYGIGYFVDSYWVMGQLGTHTSDVAIEDMALGRESGKKILAEILTDLSQYKSFIGLHSFDEPFTAQLDNIGVFSDAFYSLEESKGLDMYMNARGYWAEEDNFWGYSDPIAYDAYIKKIFEEAKPRMLSVTQYPYTSANTPESTVTALMYNQLSIYRKYSKQYGVPFWRMLQAGGQWNDLAEWIPSVDPYPSEGELLYDVNLALAYGAKAIQYFPLIQPIHFAYEEGGTYDFENRNGLIGADGNLTRWYYYAKRANEQVKAVDEYLMKSENDGIIVHGAEATKAIITNGESGEEIISSGEYKQLKKVTGDDCIVGCFNYKGGTALYVVNYNRKEKANVSLSFDCDDYRYTVIQRGKSCDVVGGRIPLTLDYGEGALVVLK